MHSGMEKITSWSDFITRAGKAEKSFLLLYKPESEQGQCALSNLTAASQSETGVPVYLADVSFVRDIHSRFGITGAPALLVFNKGNFENSVKGCQDSTFYKALMENAIFQTKAAAEGKTVKRVTVYSTPSCSWCNTLKSWLQKNGIRYSDVDVSRDQQAAEELVRRSGQQGVPQTEINGRIVVGFDQPRLKQLLEI